jgi:hypothetical protein
MNHRLDELFVRAGGQFGHYGEPILPDIEVFAELIVKECAEYAEHELDMAGYKKKFMLKHFGVEE